MNDHENVDMNWTVRDTYVFRFEDIAIFSEGGQKVGRPWPLRPPLWRRSCDMVVCCNNTRTTLYVWVFYEFLDDLNAHKSCMCKLK